MIDMMGKKGRWIYCAGDYLQGNKVRSIRDILKLFSHNVDM